MPRPPKLRVKNGRWYSEAGGRGRYYGRVEEVPRRKAQAALLTALEGPPGAPEAGEVGEGGPPPAVPPRAPQEPAGPSGITVEELAGRYLGWVERSRARQSLKGQKLHLSRFRARFRVRAATSITGADLEAFQDELAEKYPPQYVHKHAVTVRAMFNRGVRRGWLPAGFRPFVAVERVRVPRRPLLEADLPTPGEVAALLAASVPCLADLLRCYHATGARTSELIDARAGDYQPRSAQLVLGRHKRALTLRDPVPRLIVLNDEADAIVRALCEDRRASEPIFLRDDGKPWTLEVLGHRIKRVRDRAGIARPITVYSFRHLWISEALMAGVDALTVARMAGTSLAMVESVYGHFRSQSLREAQERLDRERAARHS